MAECNALPGCGGFNYIPLTSACIFYIGVGETTAYISFDYYERQQDCGGGGVTPSCPPVTERFDGQGSRNGEEIARQNNFADCFKYCIDMTTCAGFDYVESGLLDARCYTHTAGTLGNTFTGVGVVQVRVISRSCDTGVTPSPAPGACRIETMSNQLQRGGEPIMAGFIPMQMTVNECQQACLNDARCRSVDYNTNFGTCYKHYVDGVIESGTCCDHFVKRCPTCVESFVWRQQKEPVLNNNGVPSSAPQPTRTSCARECFDAANCDAFIFTLSGQCRHFFNIGPLSTSDMRTVHNVDTFTKDRCRGPPPVTLPPVTPPPSGAIEADGCVPVGYSGVTPQEYFFLIPNVGVQHVETLSTTFANYVACRGACTAKRVCRAYTFENGVCTLFYTLKISAYTNPIATNVFSEKVLCQA